MPPKRSIDSNRKKTSVDSNKAKGRPDPRKPSQPSKQQRKSSAQSNQSNKKSDQPKPKARYEPPKLKKPSIFRRCFKRKKVIHSAYAQHRKTCYEKVKDWIQRKKRLMTEGDEEAVAPAKKGNKAEDAPMLTGAEEEEEEEDTPMEVQTYSQTLHKALKFLWIPMFCIGRIPFRLQIEKNKATILFSKLSFSYIACALGAVLCWLLFLWYSYNIGILMFQREPETKTLEVDKAFLQRRIMKKYWIDIFIFWTTLFQAAFASTHILIYGETYATFVKHWYQVLDSSKTQISKSLVKFILIHYALLFSIVALMVVFFCIPKYYPPFTRTCQLIAAPYIRPFILEADLHDNNNNWYFEKVTFLGLVIYIVAVIFAWFSVIIYLVFARCFRNALHLMNQRIRMMLHPFDEPKIGPNAIRLDYHVIHKDFVQISFVGIKAGYVFGHVICCFYMTSTLCVVFELGNLVSFGSNNPTSPENLASINATFPASNILLRDPPAAKVFNLVGHLFLSVATVVITAWENAECDREAREAYQLATYKGLYSATTQLERNFIRSLWILASEKFPLTVTSQGYFRMTRGMLIAFLSCIVTYFIFLVQSKGQIEAANTRTSSGELLENLNNENGSIAVLGIELETTTELISTVEADSDPDNFLLGDTDNSNNFWSMFR